MSGVRVTLEGHETAFFSEGRSITHDGSEYVHVLNASRSLIGLVRLQQGMWVEVVSLDEPKAPAERPPVKELPKFHGPDWQQRQQQTNEQDCASEAKPEPVCVCKPGFWDGTCPVAHGDETGEQWQ